MNDAQLIRYQALQAQAERPVPPDYRTLSEQVLWDTFFVHKAWEFFVTRLEVPSTYILSPVTPKPPRFTPSASFQAAIHGFKRLLEMYESTLSHIPPDRSFKEFHRAIERATRGAVLGLGKAHNGDFRGASGWWDRARDQWDAAEQHLLQAPEALRSLEPPLIRELQRGFLAANECTWPPRIAGT